MSMIYMSVVSNAIVFAKKGKGRLSNSQDVIVVVGETTAPIGGLIDGKGAILGWLVM